VDSSTNGHDPDAASIEATARAMGWRDAHEYNGPPGRWRPAAEFIAVANQHLPVARDRLLRLTDQVSRLEKEVTNLRASGAEQLQIIRDLREMGRKADERGYQRALKEIRDQQGAAVAAGDTAVWQRLVEQEEALRSSHAAAPNGDATVRPMEPVPPQSPPPPLLSEPTQSFINANAWFRSDQILNAAMVAHHVEVLRERNVTQAMLAADPELDRDLLEEAKQRVVDAYPGRFRAAPSPPTPRPQPRRRAAAVAAPTPEPPVGRPGAQTHTIDSIADLAERAEARTAFERMRKNITGLTEREYMELYNDPHADYLILQQQRTAGQANGR
jgi:hypothetical protein